MATCTVCCWCRHHQRVSPNIHGACWGTPHNHRGWVVGVEVLQDLKDLKDLSVCVLSVCIVWCTLGCLQHQRQGVSPLGGAIVAASLGCCLGYTYFLVPTFERHPQRERERWCVGMPCRAGAMGALPFGPTDPALGGPRWCVRARE